MLTPFVFVKFVVAAPVVAEHGGVALHRWRMAAAAAQPSWYSAVTNLVVEVIVYMQPVINRLLFLRGNLFNVHIYIHVIGTDHCYRSSFTNSDGDNGGLFCSQFELT